MRRRRRAFVCLFDRPPRARGTAVSFTRRCSHSPSTLTTDSSALSVPPRPTNHYQHYRCRYRTSGARLRRPETNSVVVDWNSSLSFRRTVPTRNKKKLAVSDLERKTSRNKFAGRDRKKIDFGVRWNANLFRTRRPRITCYCVVVVVVVAAPRLRRQY